MIQEAAEFINKYSVLRAATLGKIAIEMLETVVANQLKETPNE